MVDESRLAWAADVNSTEMRNGYGRFGVGAWRDYMASVFRPASFISRPVEAVFLA
jgi:hypothetical protein